MTNRAVVFTILLCFSLTAWATEPPRGIVKSKIYTYDLIGWSFPVPDQWRVRTREEIARVRNLGKEELEKSLMQKIPTTESPLIYLQHDTKNKNRFTSDLSPYDPKVDGDYAKLQNKGLDLLSGIYKSLRMEMSEERGRATVDGISFATQLVKLYTPDRKRVLLTGMNFDALVNGWSFSMGYTVDNEDDRKAIHEALMNSKFKKK